MFNLKNYLSGFINYLNLLKEKISYLHLTGNIEDYLVKEFCYYINSNSNGEYSTVVNMGNEGEKKVDICVITGKNLDDIEIVEMIEVKTFRNWHRFRPYDAKDNIRESMKGFNKQIYSLDEEKEQHGWFRVNSNVKIIKAIGFASFISYEENNPKKEDFYSKIQNVAKEEFKDNIISEFKFQKIYEDMKVLLFNKQVFVTLRTGLWE